MNWLKFDYIPETDVKQFLFPSQRSNEYQMTINGKKNDRAGNCIASNVLYIHSITQILN